MRKRIYLSAILIVLLMIFGFSGRKEISVEALEIKDERELKAVWMSSFIGEAPYNSESDFKNRMNNALTAMEYYGLNALIFHVRTHNNAFYPSELNPIASWFANVNFEEFDPIGWLIEETHKRGIEFHAWMNPYRFSTTYQRGALPEANPQSDPDNLIVETGGSILNPAKEVVREHIYNSIYEFVTRYPSVDAIHFDDYFYITTNALPIFASERREQVNLLIEGIHNVLKDFNEENNTAIQFGISPSGIYRNGNGEVTYNEEGHPITNGSESNGFAHYDAYLHADTLLWSIEGWIDYLMPQTYWASNHPKASYTLLIDWWDKAFKYLDTNLYSGIGVYLADSSGSYGWQSNNNEMNNQLAVLESKEYVKGYSIYSFKHLLNGYNNTNNGSGNQIRNAFSDEQRRNIKIVPEIRTIPKLDVGYVSNVEVNNNKLTWSKIKDAKFYYVYYSEDVLTYSTDEIVGVVGQENEEMSFDVSSFSSGNFGVRATSKTNHLSPLLEENEVSVTYQYEDIAVTEIINKGSKAIKVTDPVKEGYLFKGFYLNDELFDFESLVYEDITLVPQFELIRYYVNLTLHYGYDSIVEVFEYEKGTVPLKPLDPERTGYTFKGWYFNQTEFDFNEPLLNTITLVAKWEEKYVDVTFDYNYNEIFNTINVLEGNKVLKPQNPVREGYTFAGWYLDNELFDFNNAVLNDLTLKAKWDKNVLLEVTFINGDEVNVISVNKGSLISAPDVIEKEGYIFAGWYNDGVLFNFNSIVEDDLTLIAVYEKIKYIEVTIDNGISLTTVLVAENKEVVIPFTPHKENYIFDGWYLNEELYDFNSLVTEEITLTAKFISIEDLLDVSVYEDTYIKEDNNGLVYKALVSEEENEHGFYLVYGVTSYEELYTEIINNVGKAFYINGKEVFKVVVGGVYKDNTYSVNLTGIPEHGYDDLITVAPYVVSDGIIVLAKHFKVSSYNNAKNTVMTESKVIKIECSLIDIKRKDEDLI